jgi:LacI family transcriptional regulator
MPIEVVDLCCVNSQCADAGKRNGGNIAWIQWSGKSKDIRFVRCSSCGARFSERKGTPMFRAQLPQKEIEAIAQHLMEGDGQRKTARLTGHKQDTVGAWTRKLGLHARAIHNQQAQQLQVPEAQFDEKWSFVGKKRGALESPGAGVGTSGG